MPGEEIIIEAKVTRIPLHETILKRGYVVRSTWKTKGTKKATLNTYGVAPFYYQRQTQCIPKYPTCLARTHRIESNDGGNRGKRNIFFFEPKKIFFTHNLNFKVINSNYKRHE